MVYSDCQTLVLSPVQDKKSGKENLRVQTMNKWKSPRAKANNFKSSGPYVKGSKISAPIIPFVKVALPAILTTIIMSIRVKYMTEK